MKSYQIVGKKVLIFQDIILYYYTISLAEEKGFNLLFVKADRFQLFETCLY